MEEEEKEYVEGERGGRQEQGHGTSTSTGRGTTTNISSTPDKNQHGTVLYGILLCVVVACLPTTCMMDEGAFLFFKSQLRRASTGLVAAVQYCGNMEGILGAVGIWRFSIYT